MWWAPYLEKASKDAAAARKERERAPRGFFAGASAAPAADAAKREAASTASSPPSDPEPWLPAAVSVEVDSAAWDVRVKQGRSSGDLASAEEGGKEAAAADGKGDNNGGDASKKKPGTLLRATYELTSVVAHLDDPETDDEEEEDEDEEEDEEEEVYEGGSGDGNGSDSDGSGLRATSRSAVRLLSAPAPRIGSDGEGHLVAHVRVPTSYLDAGSGIFAAGAGKEEKKEKKGGGSGGGEGSGAKSPTWLLINDFAIVPTDSVEPRRTYGSAKAPALLMFTRVDGGGGGGEGAKEEAVPSPHSLQLLEPLPPPPPPPPAKPERLLTDAEFVSLCARGGTGAGAAAAPAAPALVPPGPGELPRPGDLFGLDAEFVALAPALREMWCDGEIVETRPARLGLARVSVVRGGRVGGDDAGWEEGGGGRGGGESGKGDVSSSPSSTSSSPLLNVPAIDDYIRQNEPVFNYLTRWSGLRPADLDPNSNDARGGAPLVSFFLKFFPLRVLE